LSEGLAEARVEDPIERGRIFRRGIAIGDHANPAGTGQSGE
jgi:hypothetical protein